MALQDVDVSGSGRSFSEVVYTILLHRHPHYYVINFILPMLAVTLLTVATMWMDSSNMGQRINGGTKLLLCVVSIMFLTARHRPAMHGDIGSTASSRTDVLESLFVGYISTLKIEGLAPWFPKFKMVDSALRALIIWITALVIFMDAWRVKRYNAVHLYASFESDSTQLLVGFLYVMILGLLFSSTWNILWLMCVREDGSCRREPDSPTWRLPESPSWARLCDE
eukprot:CAMPEP_0168492914 /NCGR_PEP_ID=MMETSP0228-20121227/70460_1 /TAXON_ID=133427 /ORGANISM="Protoceratium reticulatum, Strain CCCM 535 (=CCMP 1889)" /LENGTH=223 /DNA_ID=CAMNT_0008509703 /DNA_START=12 /DNA_END=681 /DNA_ORIENTATION=+